MQTHVLIHALHRFCGKINSIEYDQEKHSAKFHFEKPSAAKTALMLHGGTLDGAHLTITSDVQETPASKEADAHHDGEHIDQADKPRAGSESLKLEITSVQILRPRAAHSRR